MAQVAPRRFADSIFFSGIAVLLAAYVLLGFWRSYFSAGLIFAILPSVLVQVHAVLFVGWIALFGAQIALIRTGQPATHRRLGWIMAGWAAAIVLVGPATVVMAVRRGAEGVGPGPLAGDLAQTLAFAILICLGIARRRYAPEHKRLMMLATAAIAGPAIVRWPFEFIQAAPPIGILFFYLLPALLLAAYDTWKLRRIHRATWLGLALMTTVLASFVALPAWSGWQAFTLWVRDV